MTYDPYQNQSYATLGAYSGGAYSGIGNPLQTPVSGMQTSAINSQPAWNPLAANPFTQQGYPGVQAYGAGITPQQSFQQPLQPPQQLQYYPQAALLQNPFLQQQGLAQQGVIQQGYAQNPFIQQLAAQQHLAQQILAQQAAAQQLAQQYQQMAGQQNSPFGQNALSPQSWVGQAGQWGAGQINPLLQAHLTARALQAQGINPGTGFQF